MASLALNIGLKALLGARTGLDTVGHNIANANTPGYSRQRVELSASPSILLRGLALGNGVDGEHSRRDGCGGLHRAAEPLTRQRARTAGDGKRQHHLAGDGRPGGGV